MKGTCSPEPPLPSSEPPALDAIAATSATTALLFGLIDTNKEPTIPLCSTCTAPAFIYYSAAKLQRQETLQSFVSGRRNSIDDNSGPCGLKFGWLEITSPLNHLSRCLIEGWSRLQPCVAALVSLGKWRQQSMYCLKGKEVICVFNRYFSCLSNYRNFLSVLKRKLNRWNLFMLNLKWKKRHLKAPVCLTPSRASLACKRCANVSCKMRHSLEKWEHNSELWGQAGSSQESAADEQIAAHPFQLLLAAGLGMLV